MARATMATLITRLRRAVGDPAGASPVHTDDELQDALDAHRVDAVVTELIPVRSVASGGAVSYRKFLAAVGFWEDSPLIQGSSFATVTPATNDYLRGEWTFATDQTPPLYISGQAYDLYGAAIEVLEAWLAKLKLQFDFEEDQQSFARSQKVRGIRALIAEYQRKARPPGIRLVTSRASW